MILANNVCALLVVCAAQLPQSEGELQPYERISPSGEFLLHVNVPGRRGEGPGDAVLIRGGDVVWSRTLPFTLADAAVDDTGRITGYGCPQGRPVSSCLGVSAPELRWAVIDEMGTLVGGPVEFDAGCPKATCETVHVRGTPLRALRWDSGATAQLLVVDLEFEPVLHRTLARKAALHSLPGGLLVLEHEESLPFALSFELVGTQWSARRIEGAEIDHAHVMPPNVPERRAPFERVPLGAANVGDGSTATWQDTCVIGGSRIVAAEGVGWVARVFDGITGALLMEAPANPHVTARKRPQSWGARIVPAPEGCFRVRWSPWEEPRFGGSYLRYAVPAGALGLEDPCIPGRSRWQDETWYPFGELDDRWVGTSHGLRRWSGGTWSGPALERDATGRWLTMGGGLASGPPWRLEAAGVAPDGALVVVANAPSGRALTLFMADGVALRTIPLPAGTSAQDPVPFDGTLVYLHDGVQPGLLCVLDTRDDSFRRIVLDGVGTPREVDLHVVPELGELWAVDLVRHELLRFAP